MSNLSQQKRQEMLDYLNQLKEIHTDDESRSIACNGSKNDKRRICKRGSSL